MRDPFPSKQWALIDPSNTYDSFGQSPRELIRRAVDARPGWDWPRMQRVGWRIIAVVITPGPEMPGPDEGWILH